MLTPNLSKHNVGVPKKKVSPYPGHMQSSWTLSSTGDRRIPRTLRYLLSQGMLLLNWSFSTRQQLVLGQALQLELEVRSEVCLASDKLCPQNLIRTWQMRLKHNLLDMSLLSILFGKWHTNADLLCR